MKKWYNFTAYIESETLHFRTTNDDPASALAFFQKQLDLKNPIMDKKHFFNSDNVKYYHASYEVDGLSYKPQFEVERHVELEIDGEFFSLSRSIYD